MIALPSHKGDYDAANALRDAINKENIAQYGPALLEWRQDVNWPISYIVRDVLAQFMHELEDPICDILNGYDEEWKYGVIMMILFNPDQAIPPKIYKLLLRIRDEPSGPETQSDLPEAAAEALEIKA